MTVLPKLAEDLATMARIGAKDQNSPEINSLINSVTSGLGFLDEQHKHALAAAKKVLDIASAVEKIAPGTMPVPPGVISAVKAVADRVESIKALELDGGPKPTMEGPSFNPMGFNP